MKAKKPTQTASPLQFDGGIIVRNPACSDKHLIKPAIAWLQKQPLFAGVEPIDTSNDEQETFRKVTKAIGNKRMLVAVLSGDGGFKLVAEVVARTNSTVVGLGFGNGNIIHTILNGAHSVKRPAQLTDFSLAVEKEVHFLDVEINGTTHHALVGAGFGLTGTFAQMINHPLQRSKKGYTSSRWRYFAELGLARKMVLEIASGKHLVELDDGQILSLDILNGPTLAKYMLYPGLDIAEPKALQLVVRSKENIPEWVQHTQTGRWPSLNLLPGDVAEFRIKGKGAWAYVDGESFELAPGSVFRVSVSDLTVRLLADKNARITIPPFTPMARISSLAIGHYIKNPKSVIKS